jgi:hypothetical protein
MVILDGRNEEYPLKRDGTTRWFLQKRLQTQTIFADCILVHKNLFSDRS